MRKLGATFWIVNGFALLHAVVTVLCGLGGINDGLFLTMLTMIMTLILSIRARLSAEVSAMNIILVNVIGYVLGVALAAILGVYIDSPIVVPALSTFLTTEIMGWALVWFIGILGEPAERDKMSDESFKWLILAVLMIFVVRILVNLFTKSPLFSDGGMMVVASKFVSNSVILLILIFLTVIFIRYLNHNAGIKQFERGAIVMLYVVGVSFLSALLAGYGLPFGINNDFSFSEFLEYFIVALICESAIYAVGYLSYSAIHARRTMVAEREKANQARAQYMNLKQQVNPHFLFNSLNVLDCLVAEGEKEDAREYIQKLSGLYRYMLHNENQPLVPLEDEMEYVDMFTGLLMVRFPNGLIIEKSIRDEDMRRFVFTYSVQMLVENATKHNAISADKPLTVKIVSDGEYITVSNNLNPKMVQPESTGLGLKYIKNTYAGRGKEVIIKETNDQYIVSLPLL